MSSRILPPHSFYLIAQSKTCASSRGTEDLLLEFKVAVSFLVVLVTTSVYADQVAFNNGDRLSGEILKSDAKTLVLRTTVAGEVTVSLSDVKELRSDLPIYIGLADGKTLVGIMSMREGTLQITTSGGTTLEIQKQSLVALRSQTEQLAYEKSRHQRLFRGWNGALDGGFELTRGNSETRNFRFAVRASRKVYPNELTLYSESIYSIDDLPSARPHVTANQQRGGARFYHDLTSRIFAFANTDFMTDALQDLNLRTVLGGGAGYHLIKRDRVSLDVLGGANFTRENYAEVQRNLMAGQLEEEFKFKLAKSTTLVQNSAFFPDLTEPGGNYRAKFALGTVTRIVKWFGWQNNVSDSYVTNPPAGKKQNEFVWTSGFQLAFSH